MYSTNKLCLNTEQHAHRNRTPEPSARPRPRRTVIKPLWHSLTSHLSAQYCLALWANRRLRLTMAQLARATNTVIFLQFLSPECRTRPGSTSPSLNHEVCSALGRADPVGMAVPFHVYLAQDHCFIVVSDVRVSRAIVINMALTGVIEYWLA